MMKHIPSYDHIIYTLYMLIQEYSPAFRKSKIQINRSISYTGCQLIGDVAVESLETQEYLPYLNSSMASTSASDTDTTRYPSRPGLDKHKEATRYSLLHWTFCL